MPNVSPSRLRADFDALAQIGVTSDGGMHRPTFSEAHLSARKWFREQVEKAGLEFRVDGAHNHSAFLKNAKEGAKGGAKGDAKDAKSAEEDAKVAH